MSQAVTRIAPAGVPLPAPVAAPAPRPWPRRALLATGAAALALLAAEAALRAGFDGAVWSPPVFQAVDGEVGYRLLPGVRAQVRQFGRTLVTTTDAQGHRTTVGAPAQAPRTLHLVGDSQVFGWGLSDDETVASLLQRRLGDGVRVVNHGVPGYGPDDYRRVLRALPADEAVILVHTEENDAADAYRLFPKSNVACGYVSSLFERGSAWRCALMGSRLVQVALMASLQLNHRWHMTPMGFAEHSRVAGDVLQQRVQAMTERERTERGGRIAFSVVPWKGRYSADWRADYAPPPLEDVAALPSPFADDTDMVRQLGAAPEPGSSYLDGDTHLSPLGARRMAQALWPTVQRLVK